jgi:hypothetical protein
MKLIFTEKAKQDLIRLREFIAVKNSPAAKRISQELKTAILRLIDQPEMGVRVSDRAGLRDLIKGNYVARYWVDNHTIFIIRIWHGKEARE